MVGQQADFLHHVVEAALAEQESVPVESEGFSRVPEAHDLKDAGELVFRADAQSQCRDGLAFLVAQGSFHGNRTVTEGIVLKDAG